MIVQDQLTLWPWVPTTCLLCVYVLRLIKTDRKYNGSGWTPESALAHLRNYYPWMYFTLEDVTHAFQLCRNRDPRLIP